MRGPSKTGLGLGHSQQSLVSNGERASKGSEQRREMIEMKER
jgi:hypothetical protein